MLQSMKRQTGKISVNIFRCFFPVFCSFAGRQGGLCRIRGGAMLREEGWFGLSHSQWFWNALETAKRSPALITPRTTTATGKATATTITATTRRGRRRRITATTPTTTAKIATIVPRTRRMTHKTKKNHILPTKIYQEQQQQQQQQMQM